MFYLIFCDSNIDIIENVIIDIIIFDNLLIDIDIKILKKCGDISIIDKDDNEENVHIDDSEENEDKNKEIE